MQFLSVVAAIASMLIPSMPFAEHMPYLSGSGLRADRVVVVGEDIAAAPVKIDIASLGPVLTSQSALVVDAASGAVLYEKNAHAPWTLASIVKLATAMVFLESAPNMEERLTMQEEDDAEGGDSFIRPGQSATARDFLKASLLGSANNATITLSRSARGSVAQAVRDMNAKARSLGMHDTIFVDPTGLSPENKSTAFDIVKLLAETGRHKEITDIIGTHRGTIRVFPGGVSKPVLTTNHLMGSIVFVEYGKTGHLEEAGYNLAVAVAIRGGHTLYIITLGSETNEDRVRDSKSLAIWAQNTYEWK
ncbi:MAG: serine hydrolase [bacterium]|nr:serine hydrolase [bacterium]